MTDSVWACKPSTGDLSDDVHLIVNDGCGACVILCPAPELQIKSRSLTTSPAGAGVPGRYRATKSAGGTGSIGTSGRSMPAAPGGADSSRRTSTVALLMMFCSLYAFSIAASAPESVRPASFSAPMYGRFAVPSPLTLAT